MKMKMIISAVAFAVVASTAVAVAPAQASPTSTSGVKKAYVKVPTDERGMTIEQKNIGKRILKDNQPGSVKHLYVISAYSGDVLIYSTVVGKVTSSGKRLSPVTVLAANANSGARRVGIDVNIGGESQKTAEVLQDDGTYGSSVPYVYWFDQRGVYHQHYITGGQIFHVSDKPLRVGKVILNMEVMAEE